MKRFGIFFVIVIFSLACNFWASSPSKEASNDTIEVVIKDSVHQVLERSFRFMGGYQRWKSIDTLKFNKLVILYGASGEIENEVMEHHTYVFYPKPFYQITWTKDDIEFMIVSENGQMARLINGVPDTTARLENLKQNLASATFVAGLPYKLFDKGPVLDYIGLDTLPENRVVQVIRATYDPEKSENVTTPDIWWHFFDVKSGEHLGYKVKHDDHISWVENQTTQKYAQFLFPGKRSSYRVNENDEKLFLRAYYEYSNYQIHFID